MSHKSVDNVTNFAKCKKETTSYDLSIQNEL
jgi:hypothetical protein